MGYYIQVPKNLNKAQQLIDIYGAQPLVRAPKAFHEMSSDRAIICVVQNGGFDAAAYCYDEAEFEAFKAPDVYCKPSRRRTWLTMDKNLVEKLSGYTEKQLWITKFSSLGK